MAAQDLTAVRSPGATDVEVVEVVANVALTVFTNYLNEVAATDIDRVVHVEDESGRVITARSRPRLLIHGATLGADGEPLVDGGPWISREVTTEIENAAGGPGARLGRDESLERFDIPPLLVATDGAISSLGYARRRFRPNLLIAGVAGLAERAWEGRHLQVGGAVIRIVSLRRRGVGGRSAVFARARAFPNVR